MSATAPRIAIDNTFGSAFIGALVTVMLYGITTLQTFFYFINYPQDAVSDKLLVYGIWILDTVHAVLVSVCMYHYLVTNYANPTALAIGHWSLFASVALNVIIAFFVQSFFTFRIFYLSGRKARWWLTSIIAIFVLLHLVFGMETVGFLFVKKEFSRLHEFTLTAAMPFALCAVLSDVLIAGALCVLLHGNRSNFHSTNTLVTTLIVYSINRCLLTSAVAVAEVITFAVKPDSLWFLAIDFVIGKLYANSLLATLNSRRSLQARGSKVHSVRASDIVFDEEAKGRNDSTEKGVVVRGLRPDGDLDTTGSQSTRRSAVTYTDQLELPPALNDV